MGAALGAINGRMFTAVSPTLGLAGCIRNHVLDWDENSKSIMREPLPLPVGGVRCGRGWC